MSSTERFILVVTVCLGILVRFVPIAGAAAATGDGGLFLSMIEDVRAAGGIPPTTSFNHADLPFLYPPLGFLVGAAVGNVTGADTLSVLRWLPFLISVLTILAFAWMAFQALPGRAALGATFVYALAPHAYDWVIAGGGLTRSLGIAFAILAIGRVARRDGASNGRAVQAGALLALAALSHPQAWIFGVLGCVVLSWEPTRAWVARTGVAALSFLVIVAPWIIWTMAQYGFDALGVVSYRAEPFTGLIQVLSLEFSGVTFMDVFAVAAGVGLFISLARREFRVPILLMVVYLTGAGGGEFMGTVAWAMVAGIGLAELMGLMERALADMPRRRRRLALEGLGALVLLLAMIGSIGSYAGRSSKLQALSGDNIAATRWLSAHSDPDATVIVPTNEWWGDDEVSEWLPALSDRRSYGTVQGSEWLGPERFNAQEKRHVEILSCAGSTAACYADIDPDALLFVPKGPRAGPFSPVDCCPAVRSTLADNGYEIIYDGPGATIAQPSG